MAPQPGDEPVNSPYKKRRTGTTTTRSTGSYRPTNSVNVLGGNTNRTGYRAGSAQMPMNDATGRSTYQAPTLASKPAFDMSNNSWYWAEDPVFDNNPLPPWTPPGPSGNGGGGGGGGGGGAPAIDTAAIMGLVGRRPQQQTWQNLDMPDYQAQPFYNFDTTQYDKARTGIAEGVAADRSTGNQAYQAATTELQQYQNPFANRQYTQNQPMDQAMQRMMQANGVQADQATQQQGVQADAAFGNVLGLLGGAANQYQASGLRALGGDQRRFDESLNNQARNMNLGVDMRQAAAQDQYNKDKWQYGESVARYNYEQNMQEGQYNNQGQNTTNAANVQGNNTWDANTVNTLIQLIANGAQFDPAMLAQYGLSGIPGAAPAAAPAA